MSNNLQAKIQKVLDDSGINGAIMLVYEDKDSEVQNGMHATGFVLAVSKFSQTYTVGQFMQCLGRMIVEGAIHNKNTGLPDRSGQQS